MPRTPEGKVKDKCVEIIKHFGAYYFFCPANGMGRSGIPDVIVCYRGKFLGVECKAGFNKATALQEREMSAIRRANGSTLVIREDTLDELERWFKDNIGG